MVTLSTRGLSTAANKSTIWQFDKYHRHESYNEVRSHFELKDQLMRTDARLINNLFWGWGTVLVNKGGTVEKWLAIKGIAVFKEACSETVAARLLGTEDVHPHGNNVAYKDMVKAQFGVDNCHEINVNGEKETVALYPHIAIKQEEE